MQFKLTFIPLILLFGLSGNVTAEEDISKKENLYFELENPNIKRGEYLSDILMCSGCHSPFTLENGMESYNAKTRLAGGIKFGVPGMGFVYIKNITSDLETGIGQWTFTELQRAITEGIGKHGNRLVGMNSANYKNLTNDDLNAVVAYLKSTPPIWHKVPAYEPITVDNQISTINFYFGNTGEYKNKNQNGKKNSEASFTTKKELKKMTSEQEIKRGDYLVTTAACQQCHTPIAYRGTAKELTLAGGMKFEDPICGTVISSNITSDNETGLGRWSESEIVRAITRGVSKDGRTLCHTAMPWINFINMNDIDAHAIAAYLKSTSAVFHKIPDGKAPTKGMPPVQKIYMGDSGNVKNEHLKDIGDEK
jgi:mono/diheme cytochrome c family protein